MELYQLLNIILFPFFRFVKNQIIKNENRLDYLVVLTPGGKLKYRFVEFCHNI